MAEDPQQRTDDPPPEGGGRWSNVWPVLLPTLTFLVGIGLGAGATLLSSSSGGGEAEPTSPPSPTRTADDGDTVIVVPAACEDAADNLETATRLLDDVAGSIRDFRPNELVELLNELEELDQAIRAQASECSSDASVTEEPSGTITGEPEETESSP